MEYRIIKAPSRGTKEMLVRRMAQDATLDLDGISAIGLVQGRMIDMVCASDIAEKAVGVVVKDIRGSCPQNMILIAIFGDTSSVEAALEEIKFKFGEGEYTC